MRTRSTWFGLMAVLLVVFGAPALSAVTVNDNVAVSVRETQLRATPAFLARITAVIEYGEAVTVLEVRTDWARVRVDSSRAEGWLHTSAVVPPKDVQITRGAGTTGTPTSREIALAGRGFNQTIEREYQADTGLDFSRVDRMEENVLPVDDLVVFLDEIGSPLTQEARDAR